jgi:HindVP restriction endonuclease
MSTSKPGLFGLKKTNRDFTLRDSWGKNQFNSSFPAALCCYMHAKGNAVNYLSIIRNDFKCVDLAVEKVFGIDPLSDDIYFAFESHHSPYQKFVVGNLPRTDLVVQRESTGECLAGLEVKLTALPDNTTCELPQNQYGSEIVIRPDTIVYLACSLALRMGESLKALIPNLPIIDWSEPGEVEPHMEVIAKTISSVAKAAESVQWPFLLQPIWKTKGKSPELADKCLDVFVWSDAGFAYFISELSLRDGATHVLSRQKRSSIWLFKMLHEIKTSGRFNHERIIDELLYNTKNDKAFASAGNITNLYMASPRLQSPLIGKDEIKNIILGGGQTLLSPERRFDAILFSSPSLFS